jgi:hypothetical protein
MFKHTIKTTLLAALIVGVLSSNIQVSHAHYISSIDEWNYGKQAMASYNYSILSNNVLELSDILFKLNATNPTILPDGGQADSYLRTLSTPVLSSDLAVNAMSYPGGFTIVNRGMWNLIFTDNTNNDDWQNMGSHEMATKNTMAFVVAHEFGHFVNEDFLRKNDTETNLNTIFGLVSPATTIGSVGADIGKSAVSKLSHRGNSAKYENEADAKALEFTENSWDYNAGGGLIFFNRLIEQDAKNTVKQKDNWEFPHPETVNRFAHVCDFIKNQSDGRVLVDKSTGAVTINGQPFFIKSDHYGISDQEQTWETAGAIAKAIKFAVTDIVTAPHNDKATVEAISANDYSDTRSDIYVVKSNPQDRHIDNISYLMTIDVNYKNLNTWLHKNPLPAAEKAKIDVEMANVEKIASYIKPSKTDPNKSDLGYGEPKTEILTLMSLKKLPEKIAKTK